MNKRVTLVADLETTTGKINQEKSQMWLGCYKYLDSEQPYFFYDIKEFFDCLEKIDSNVLKIYFHNLSFDGQFILNYILSNGYEQTLDKNISNPYTFKIVEAPNTIYKITLKTPSKLIYFEDSFKILVHSIKHLGEKVVNLKKLELDYDVTPNEQHDYPPQAYEYCARDVEIARLSLLNFQKMYGLERSTIASISYAHFLKYVTKAGLKKMFTFSEEQFYTFKKWYHGGITTYRTQETNKFIKGNWKVYDINSSYPYQMTKLLPYGEPLKEQPEGPYCCFYEIYVKHAVIKNKDWIPLFYKPPRVLSDNVTQYMKEIRNTTVYYTDIEWRWITRFYNVDCEIKNTWYFKTKNFLKNIVEPTYKLREKAKKEKNDVLSFLYKIFLNSIYGKFGQAPIKKSIYYSKETNQERLCEFLYSKGYILYGKRTVRNNIGNHIAYVIEPDKAKDVKYIPLACYITALARVELMKGIWPNVDKVYYTDTDSIFVKGKAKGLTISKTKLGAWDCEHEAKYFNVLQAKFYRFEDENHKVTKSGSCGVSKKVVDAIPYTDYKLGMIIQDGKLAKVKVDGGIILLEKDIIIGNKKEIELISGGN